MKKPKKGRAHTNTQARTHTHTPFLQPSIEDLFQVTNHESAAFDVASEVQEEKSDGELALSVLSYFLGDRKARKICAVNFFPTPPTSNTENLTPIKKIKIRQTAGEGSEDILVGCECPKRIFFFLWVHFFFFLPFLLFFRAGSHKHMFKLGGNQGI